MGMSAHAREAVLRPEERRGLWFGIVAGMAFIGFGLLAFWLDAAQRRR